MSFTRRFDLPSNYDDDDVFEDCDNCRAKTYCHKLSYCIQEELE